MDDRLLLARFPHELRIAREALERAHGATKDGTIHSDLRLRLRMLMGAIALCESACLVVAEEYERLERNK